MIDFLREALAWIAAHPHWTLLVVFLCCLGESIIVLGVLIFVHELGHFLAAKAAGMRCVVVPCAHTRHQDFDECDHRLAALPELLTLL